MQREVDALYIKERGKKEIEKRKKKVEGKEKNEKKIVNNSLPP